MREENFNLKNELLSEKWSWLLNNLSSFLEFTETIFLRLAPSDIKIDDATKLEIRELIKKLRNEKVIMIR